MQIKIKEFENHLKRLAPLAGLGTAHQAYGVQRNLHLGELALKSHKEALAATKEAAALRAAEKAATKATASSKKGAKEKVPNEVCDAYSTKRDEFLEVLLDFEPYRFQASRLRSLELQDVEGLQFEGSAQNALVSLRRQFYEWLVRFDCLDGDFETVE